MDPFPLPELSKQSLKYQTNLCFYTNDLMSGSRRADPPQRRRERHDQNIWVISNSIKPKLLFLLSHWNSHVSRSKDMRDILFYIKSTKYLNNYWSVGSQRVQRSGRSQLVSHKFSLFCLHNKNYFFLIFKYVWSHIHILILWSIFRALFQCWFLLNKFTVMNRLDVEKYTECPKEMLPFILSS